MKRLQTKLWLVGLLSLLIISTSPAFAQVAMNYAELRGTVEDASQAAVPRATVTATNDATNVTETSVTDEQGRYTFLALRPASYTIKVEASGFKTAVQSGVVLRVGQRSDLDFTLEVGEITTTVEITAASPLLNTVSAALGAEVDNRYITEVPLFDREITRLAYLAPGVTATQGDPFSDSPTGFTGTNFTSNGQRSSTAEVRWDGASSSPPDGTGAGMSFFYPWTQPSPEFVQEFKVETNSFSAEYGNNGGTVLNIVSRSGGNEFHGSGYYWGRRPRWDANGFFANKGGAPKPSYKRDNYGGSIGGPIFKNKTFFFFDYDRIDFQSPGTTKTTVPTALERRGDFSQSFNADGSLRQIFDPNNITVINNPDGTKTYKRSPFPGNIIPPALIDPVAAKLMSFYPEPTGSGDPITGRNNFVRNYSVPSPSNKWDLKIDHVFSDKHRISGRYSRAYTGSVPANLYGEGNPADPSASTSDYVNHNGVLEYTWSVTPTMIWTNRAALTRYVRDSLPVEFDPTTLGFPSYLVTAGAASLFPLVWAPDPATYAGLGTSFALWIEHDTQPSWSSSLSKIWGAHNTKFGYEHRSIFGNYLAPGSPNGGFQFSPGETQEILFTSNPAQGHPIASLLTGWGSWGFLDIQPASATKSAETGFYVQDDWRVTQKLTLNLGLRYEWQSPYTERYDRLQIADWNADTGIDVPTLGRMRGVSRFAEPGQRSISPDRNNIAPRFGFAYRLGSKSVVRGGAGVYYSITQLQGDWRIGSAFRKQATWFPSQDGGITQFATLSDPFPTRAFQPQERRYGKLAEWGFGPGDQISGDPARNPEIYQWSLGFQHQLTDTLLLEVAYNGNRTTHLAFDGTQNRNLLFREVRDQYTPGQLAELVPNPFQPFFQGPSAIFNEPDSLYNNDTISRSSLLRPYPQFGGFSSKNAQPRSSSEYNSLLFRFEKRFSHGLNFVGHYTYSNYHSDSGANTSWLGNSPPIQDVYNLRDEWSLDGADTPHRFVFGYTYELPVGRGRALGSNMNRVLDKIVGGWQFNGVLTFQSGNPIALFSFNSFPDGTQRPNLKGNPRSQLSTQEVVDGKGFYFNFNPSALDCSNSAAGAICAPPVHQPGNATRFIDGLREPMLNNLDLSIFKNFKFWEGSELQLRAEFFNFTNTPVFAVGDALFYGAGQGEVVLGNPSFGTIEFTRNNARQFQIGIRFIF